MTIELAVTPNPDGFVRNERTGEYIVKFRLSGTISMTIKAGSDEGAKSLADAEADRIKDAGYTDLDTLEGVDIEYISRHPPMYLITRDGRNMQTSRLKPGDTPREPDEHGY